RVDERPHGADHTVIVQRLSDRGRRVAGLDLDHHVALAGAGVVITAAEYRVPQLGADENGDHHDHGQQGDGDPAGEAAPAFSALGTAAPGLLDAAHLALGCADRFGFGPSGAVNHRRSPPAPIRTRRRDVDPASSAGSPPPPPDRSPPAALWPAPPPRAATA